MSHMSGRAPANAVERAITLGVAIISFSACSKDSTSSPVLTPATVAVVSGGAQTATAGTPVAASIVVKVTDASGAPVGGVIVTFAPAPGSGVASMTQVSTDGSGLAQVSWTLGTRAGTDSMTVSVGALAPAAVLATAK